MAALCAFTPLDRCLRADAKVPKRQKGGNREKQWLAHADRCRYVLSSHATTQLRVPALAGNRICERCYKACPRPAAPAATEQENAAPAFLQPGGPEEEVLRLRGGAVLPWYD